MYKADINARFSGFQIIYLLISVEFNNPCQAPFSPHENRSSRSILKPWSPYVWNIVNLFDRTCTISSMAP